MGSPLTFTLVIPLAFLMLDPISCSPYVFLTHFDGAYPLADFTFLVCFSLTCHPQGFSGKLEHQLYSVHWYRDFQGLLSSYFFL